VPNTEQAKQREWNTILPIAKNNGFPLQLITKTQQTLITQTHQKKKWIIFTYHRPLTHKITKLITHTDIKIAFRSIVSI